jgi:hypothetical protein
MGNPLEGSSMTATVIETQTHRHAWSSFAGAVDRAFTAVIEGAGAAAVALGRGLSDVMCVSGMSWRNGRDSRNLS